MLRGEMSPGVFLAEKIIIVNIDIGFYIPQRVFMSITIFIFPTILWAKVGILQIKEPRFSKVNYFVQSNLDWEWCGQDMNLGLQNPNSELSLGYCGASLHNQLKHSVLFCFVGGRGISSKGKELWRTGGQPDYRSFQCQANEISYVYQLLLWKENQENKNISIFWRTCCTIAGNIK